MVSELLGELVRKADPQNPIPQESWAAGGAKSHWEVGSGMDLIRLIQKQKQKPEKNKEKALKKRSWKKWMKIINMAHIADWSSSGPVSQGIWTQWESSTLAQDFIEDLGFLWSLCFQNTKLAKKKNSSKFQNIRLVKWANIQERMATKEVARQSL